MLKEGQWMVRARIPKHENEAFTEAEHVRERDGIQVLQKKLFGSTHGGLAPGICYSEFCVNPRVSPRVSWLLITLI